jgi:hypothetical protein
MPHRPSFPLHGFVPRYEPFKETETEQYKEKELAETKKKRQKARNQLGLDFALG